VREAAAELTRGPVGGKRDAARQRQTLGFVSAREAEPHDPPLQVTQADGHRVASGGGTDHDDPTGPAWEPLGQRQCDHAAVGRPDHGMEGPDAGLLARGNDRRGLIAGADGREGLAPRWRSGRAPAAQPVETDDLEPVGVEWPPRTHVPLPPAGRMCAGGDIAPGGDSAKHKNRGPPRCPEPSETHHARPEQTPAGESQSTLQGHLEGGAGMRAHALTGRSRSKPA